MIPQISRKAQKVNLDAIPFFRDGLEASRFLLYRFTSGQLVSRCNGQKKACCARCSMNS